MAEPGRLAKNDASPTGPRAVPDAQAREDRPERRSERHPVHGHEQGSGHERRHVEEEEPQESRAQALGDHTFPELQERDGLRVEQTEDLLPGVADEQDEPSHL